MKSRIEQHMKTPKRITTAVCAALLLIGCDVKDDIYNTSHPEHGTITVTTDWSDMGTGLTKPAAYTIEIGNYQGKATTDTHTPNHLFEAGSYTINLYNEAPEISVAGAEATVNAVTPPAGITVACVAPLPGWLFAGQLAATINKDANHAFSIPMKQQVRQLTLIIGFEGSMANKVAAITATLSGVAAAWNLGTNQPQGNAANVAPEFTKITSGADAGKWTATVRLLGTTGTAQKLTGTISFAGGTPADMPLNSDFSADLSNFNSDKRTPLILGGTAVETPTEIGITATINDWKEVTGSGTAE